MDQFNQAGIDVVSNCDSFESQPDNEESILNSETMAETGLLCRVSIALPKVAILLCTYHGQRYLAEQLDSFETQSHSNWEVWASDDGSKDGTLAILEAYQERWSVDRLFIHSGPAKGFAANFLSLTCKANIDADYYAYSDQDDVWEQDRLRRALDWLKIVPPDVPALYLSRTRYIYKDGSNLGFSTHFKKPPSFQNALVQSIAGGNTMVFNQAARSLLAKTPSSTKIASHDWWVYMLVSGCGGRVFYDSFPGVRYRQHGSNVAGQNTTVLAKLSRAKGLFAGKFKKWNQTNLSALNEMMPYLTNENRRTLALFSKARSGLFFSRIYNFYRSGVYRQTFSGNVGLLIAVLLRKI